MGRTSAIPLLIAAAAAWWPGRAEAVWEPPLGLPAPAFGITQTAPSDPAPWSGTVSGFYWVEPTHPSATDSSNPNGWPARPRRTIPGSLPAGAVVELRGTYSDEETITASGTAGQPVFIRGASPSVRPRITQVWVLSGAYLILENLDWDTQDVNAIEIIEPASHIALRNSDLSGTLGGGGLDIYGSSPGTVSNVVVYNNAIHDNGNVDANFDQDIHGIAIGDGARYVWVVDNALYRNSGDGLQINGPAEFVYVGRNVSHHNKQTGLWSKRASDIIFSQNLSYGHRPSDSSYGAGMGFQYGPERIWFLFNHLHDNEYGIAASSDLDDGGDGQNSYFIGNVIHDIHGAGYSPGSGWSPGAFMFAGGRNRYLVNNTIHDVEGGINMPPSGGFLYMVNNIISDVDGQHILLEPNGSTSVMHHNLLAGPVRINWGGTFYTSLSAFQAGTGKGQSCIAADPAFVNPAGHDFRLQPTSLSVNAGVLEAVYAAYLTRYGIDIAKDVEGLSRPNGAAWDLGAHEYEAQPNVIFADGFDGAALLAWFPLTEGRWPRSRRGRTPNPPRIQIAPTPRGRRRGDPRRPGAPRS